MIIISPYAKPLPNGGVNPKNYPYWKELLGLISEPVVQVGVTDEQQLTADFRKNLTMCELENLVQTCRTWISCDSFFQHFCWDLGKPGVVIWGQSDPNIFGHPENINLLKNRDCLAENQFYWWEMTEYDKNKFVTPQEVLRHL